MRTWAERNQGPGLADMLRTAMALRSAKQQEQQQQQQQEQNQWQFERAKAEDERQQDYRTLLGGENPEEARLADPQRYDEWQRAQAKAQIDARKNALDMQKTAFETQKIESGLVDDKEKNTLGLQQRLLSAAQAGADIANLRKARDAAVKTGRFNTFALPGDGDAFADLTDTPKEREAQITQLQRQAGVEAPKPPNSVQEYEYALSHPGYDAREIALANAKSPKTNVHVGGQTLPANQLAEIADFNTAIESLSNLRADFKKLVPAGDVVDQMKARGEALIPNSKVAQYNDMVLQAQQLVGLILENGKLVGGDEAKYRKMLPKPGDSYETVQLKIDSLVRDLSIKGRNRAKAYGQGGYKVPEVLEPQQQSPQQGSSGQISREDQISKRVAEMKGVLPEVQIQNLKSEGLFTEQQAAEALQAIRGGR